MKLDDQQKEALRQLNRSGCVPALLKELTEDTRLSWQRADTKEKREEAWHLTRAITKLATKFEIIFREAEVP
jgi:hypothetical protein